MDKNISKNMLLLYYYYILLYLSCLRCKIYLRVKFLIFLQNKLPLVENYLIVIFFIILLS